MRILHVLPPAAGGMVRHVGRLMAGLDAAAWEQYCAAAPGGAAQLPASRRLPLPLVDGAGAAALLRAAIEVARLARRVRAELIHGHGYRGMLLAAGAGRFCRRPFVFTAHNLPSELGAGFWRLAAPLCRGARGAVCVSEAIARDLAGRLGWSREGAREGAHCLRVVHNGVDVGPPVAVRRALPADLGCAGRRPVLLTAARLAWQKGVGVLLGAWPRVATQFPDAVLVVAGDGPLRPELQARVSAARLEESVRFVGFRDDVRALLEAADVAVVPSLVEGQSVFAVEAMAAGATVVASRTGGVPEMVRDEETGLLVPPGDAGALGEALCRALSDDELRCRLAASARRFVEAEMTVARMLERMQSFYEECMSPR